MKPSELQFLSEDALVSIIPNITLPEIHLMSGTFGPFTANVPTEVPLWLALLLSKRGKCRVNQPEWMRLDELKAKYEDERRAPADEHSTFEPMPFHYLEMAMQLLQTASKQWDLNDTQRIRTVLEDLDNVRQSKINEGLRKLNEDTTLGFKINNLSAMEINRMRDFVCDSLYNVYQLSREWQWADDDQAEEEEEEGNTAARVGEEDDMMMS